MSVARFMLSASSMPAYPHLKAASTDAVTKRGHVPRQPVNAVASFSRIGAWVLLPAFLIACPAPAQQTQTAVPPQTTPAKLTITLRTAADHVEARVVSSTPITELEFDQRGSVRRDAWEVTTEGVKLHDDTIEATAPITQFEMSLAVDPEEYDRVYPSVTRVGDGFVVYGPALLATGIQTELVVAPADDESAWPPEDALRGYVYLGPTRELSRHGQVRLAGVGTVAPWLAEQITADAKTTLPLYATMLQRPERQPALFIAGDGPGPMSFHGDVTDNDVVFLRFHGERWREPDPGASAQVGKFVRHEAFHLWNARNAPGVAPWLHEGGAEYAAIVASVHAGALSHAQGVEQVAFHVQRCKNALEERPFAELEPSGGAVYNCGVAAQWVADVETRSTSQGKRNTFTIWRELLDRADATDGYTIADFRDAAGPLTAMLLDGDPEGRWPKLAAALHPLGVTVSDQPSNADFRSAAVHHLLAQHCGERPRGFWTESASIRLDTGDRCGPLSGDPEIVAIEGHDLTRSADAVFDALDGACGKEDPLTLRRVDGTELEVACAEAPVRPSVFRIEAAPALTL
ncbi:MAG: hypothetical protein AAF721_01560 [Myxococcota bacterium]